MRKSIGRAQDGERQIRGEGYRVKIGLTNFMININKYFTKESRTVTWIYDQGKPHTFRESKNTRWNCARRDITEEIFIVKEVAKYKEVVQEQALYFER